MTKAKRNKILFRVALTACFVLCAVGFMMALLETAPLVTAVTLLTGGVCLFVAEALPKEEDKNTLRR